MKNKYFVLLFIIITGVINAEEKFSFQIKPIRYLLSITQTISADYNFDIPTPFYLDLEFQYAINNKFTLFINPTFANAYTLWSYPYDENDPNNSFRICSLSALNLVTGLLYRPYETGLRGMYIGIFPVIGWEYLNEAQEKIKDFFNLGYMAEIGKQWIFKNGFTITFGGGICKIYRLPLDKSINERFSFVLGNLYGYTIPYPSASWKLPFDIRIRFSIGYSF